MVYIIRGESQCQRAGDGRSNAEPSSERAATRDPRLVIDPSCSRVHRTVRIDVRQSLQDGQTDRMQLTGLSPYSGDSKY
jgi:hypothetical protein